MSTFYASSISTIGMAMAQMLYAQSSQPARIAHHDMRSKSLYTSHFMSTWNSRGFEFGAVLFLATIYPGTLLPMSIYALVRSMAAIVLSPTIGRFIDRGNRLKVIRISIAGQRLSVASSCILFLVALRFRNVLTTYLSVALFIALTLLACMEKLSIILNTIAVERDWIVVIAAGDEALLREMNSQMRRIDLFCKLVSPLFIALLNGFSSVAAVLVTLGVNFLSVSVEYLLIAWVYGKTPSLAVVPTEGGSNEIEMEDIATTANLKTSTISSILKQGKGYTTSHAFLPSLSLSMLYLTVLSFSGQMVTYLFTLDHPRLNSTHIGLLRTIATGVEISATYIAPLLINQVGPVRAGIWSLSWQLLTLTPGVATFWILPSSSTLKTFLFITSVVVSRMGLWTFDLTAQLLVQNSVDSRKRGSFSATESSLQNFFELCAFILTIIWSDPADFIYPATISLVAIYMATVLYARYVRMKRGHLLHLPDCCMVGGKYEILPTDEGSELVSSERT